VLFAVGGHAPMQDLAFDPSIGPLMVALPDDPGKLVVAVCHSPASMLWAARADGTWLSEGAD
jgi:putative intracellular protease/amidase